MPSNQFRTRVGGSAFTVFHWNDGSGDVPIGWAKEIRTSGVTPVADPVVIQPLNQPQPVEIITPGAHANGVLTMVLTELYNKSVWNRLGALVGSQDIIDIMRYIAELDNGVKITKFIKAPFMTTATTETYHNCVITRVADDETINIASMDINKEIEVWYTKSFKKWINGGARQIPLNEVL